MMTEAGLKWLTERLQEGWIAGRGCHTETEKDKIVGEFLLRALKDEVEKRAAIHCHICGEPGAEEIASAYGETMRELLG